MKDFFVFLFCIQENCWMRYKWSDIVYNNRSRVAYYPSHSFGISSLIWIFFGGQGDIAISNEADNGSTVRSRLSYHKNKSNYYNKYFFNIYIKSSDTRPVLWWLWWWKWCRNGWYVSLCHIRWTHVIWIVSAIEVNVSRCYLYSRLQSKLFR